METLSLILFAVAKSGLPSPLKSPLLTERGSLPVRKRTWGAEGGAAAAGGGVVGGDGPAWGGAGGTRGGEEGWGGGGGGGGAWGGGVEQDKAAWDKFLRQS